MGRVMLIEVAHLKSPGGWKKANALVNTKSPWDSYPMGYISSLPSYFSPKVNRISCYLLFKMATCCHRVPNPYHKSTLVVFWDGHILDVFLLNKTLHKGLQENDTSLCLFFHGALPPKCFCKERVGHCGSIRSPPFPFLFLFSMCFLSSIWRITLCNLRGRALCTQSGSGGLKGLQLTGAVVPCVNSGVRSSQRSRVSHCPVQLWEWAACLCSSMWLSRELAITPTGAGLQGLQNKAEAATSVGFSPVPAEHSTNFMDTHCALGIILGDWELLGKYRSDMGSVPMELTFWWESQGLNQSSENVLYSYSCD